MHGLLDAPAFPASTLERIERLPGVSAAGGDVRARAEIVGAERQGRSRAAAQRDTASASTPATSASARSGSSRAAGRPAPARSRSTPQTADSAAPRGRRAASASSSRADASSTTRSPAIVDYGSATSLAGATISRLRPRDRADAVRQAGRARPDRRRREAGRRDRDAARPDQVGAARPTPRCAPAGSRRRPRSTTSAPLLTTLPLLPARLRRHRALRRRVRDREHALDHRRPARARVRDAADARRELAPGAPTPSCSRGS